MGTVISKATDGIGDLLEKAFLSPFKTMFDGSCQECPGPWDLVCFIEHLCVTNLLKLLMILVLCYITLLFFYLVFKLGIFQCIGKSLCKCCWGACETYWFALHDICSFFWYKLRNTRRVNRRRRRHFQHHRQFKDIEQGYSSSGDDDDDDMWSDSYGNLNVCRKRKSLSRRRRKDAVQNSMYHSNRHGTRSHRHHQHVKLKTRSKSVRVVGRSQRPKSLRRMRVSKVRNAQRKTRTLKRRKLSCSDENPAVADES